MRRNEMEKKKQNKHAESGDQQFLGWILNWIVKEPRIKAMRIETKYTHNKKETEDNHHIEHHTDRASTVRFLALRIFYLVSVLFRMNRREKKKKHQRLVLQGLTYVCI